MNKIKLLLAGVASMGVASFAYAANEVPQTPPCSQQPDNQECPMPCDMQGPDGRMMPPPPPQNGAPECGMPCMDNASGMGRNFHGRNNGMDRPGRMMRGEGPDFGRRSEPLPDEIKARMDTLHSDREALRELWIKAVLTRGDKPVATLREEFAKTNAGLISKIDKSEKSIQEDIDALRSGFDKNKDDTCREPQKRDDEGEMAPFGMQPFCGETPFGSDKELISKIDAEVVAAITALKGPLTVEQFAKIRDEAISKNRQELDKIHGVRSDMRFGMREGMPMLMPMDPALSRMRDEMGHMRGEDLRAKRELRVQLREAMKIQDQVKREAAVKKILEDMADSPDTEKAQPQATK